MTQGRHRKRLNKAANSTKACWLPGGRLVAQASEAQPDAQLRGDPKPQQPRKLMSSTLLIEDAAVAMPPLVSGSHETEASTDVAASVLLPIVKDVGREPDVRLGERAREAQRPSGLAVAAGAAVLSQSPTADCHLPSGAESSPHVGSLPSPTACAGIYAAHRVPFCKSSGGDENDDESTNCYANQSSLASSRAESSWSEKAAKYLPNPFSSKPTLLYKALKEKIPKSEDIIISDDSLGANVPCSQQKRLRSDSRTYGPSTSSNSEQTRLDDSRYFTDNSTDPYMPHHTSPYSNDPGSSLKLLTIDECTPNDVLSEHKYLSHDNFCYASNNDYNVRLTPDEISDTSDEESYTLSSGSSATLSCDSS